MGGGYSLLIRAKRLAYTLFPKKKIFLLSILIISILGCEAKKDDLLTTPPTPVPPTPEYTITFNTDGGNTIASVKVQQGDKLTKPVNPTKNDYIFADWYKEKDLSTLFDFDKEPITANITIYAKWRKIGKLTFSTIPVVSSVQLEMSSNLEIADIGAVIRLATEDTPTKTEAEASAGYVSLHIEADSPRKFSISQHYTTNFDGRLLTLDDVLAPDTNYKLYLFFDNNTLLSLSQVNIKGATLAKDVVSLSFTTTNLPPAGDAVWARSMSGEQFVGSLPEWNYSENQKGIFVAYTQLINPLNSTQLSTISASNISAFIGVYSLGLATPEPSFYFGFAKLGNGYPDDYYYVIGADKTMKMSEEKINFESVNFSQIISNQVPLNRY